MKRYESYKDSGIQWIGEIPGHWDLLPLKYYISFTKGRIPSETTDKCIGYPYLTMDYLRNRNDKQVVYPNNSEGLPLMNDGDILVLWDGANAGEFIKSRKGYLGSTMAKISFDEKIFDKSYFYYLLCSMESISKEFANGTTIPHFDSKVLVDYAYPCPNLSEQQAIVSYLDLKVGQIETAIAESEQMCENLKTYRLAIIREVVTKGLYKKVKMKDSGIQWIGEIPGHWDLLPLKYYISFTKGRIPSETTDKCIGYPYLTMDYLRNRNDKQVVYPNNSEGLPLMNDGDILVLWDGANAGEFIKSRKGYLGSTMAKISFDEKIFDKSYFYYLLCSMESISKEFANGTTIPHFDSKVLVDYAYPCPNLSEQQAIVSYLDLKVGQIETAIAESEQICENLKTYRLAIIRETVTGKMDLRDWKLKK